MHTAHRSAHTPGGGFRAQGLGSSGPCSGDARLHQVFLKPSASQEAESLFLLQHLLLSDQAAAEHLSMRPLRSTASNEHKMYSCLCDQALLAGLENPSLVRQVCHLHRTLGRGFLMGPRWCRIHVSPGEVQDLQGHEGAHVLFMLKTGVSPALTAPSHPGSEGQSTGLGSGPGTMPPGEDSVGLSF